MMSDGNKDVKPAARRFNSRRSYRRWLKRHGAAGSATTSHDARHSLETLEQRTLLSAAPVFELSDLLAGNGGNGSEGVVINGVSVGDRAGVSVSSAGDINGDGYDDVIIGAFRDAPNGADSGASFVVFGQAGGFNASLQLSTLNGSNGFKINGVAAGDFSGRAVASAGDINGDGFDDLMIGSFLASPNGAESGQVHVVYGKAGGYSATLELSALNGSNGFSIDGVNAGDRLGFSIRGAGDVNADGIDDFIIGASLSATNGADSGSAYVVFGQTGFGSSFDLTTLNGSNGFTINGVSSDDQLGISVNAAGDVNGDGIGDVVVGAFQDDPNGADSGAAYVIFGKTSAFSSSFNPATLNGTNGFIINGESSADNAGRSVSSAGDFNGDGFADVLIGAPESDGATAGSGSAYVVFGQGGAFASSISLSTLNGTNGFQLNGINNGDRAGLTVGLAGDVNGDGLDDLLVAADRGNPNGIRSGETYLVLGRSTAMPASINMSALSGADGFVLNGINAQDSSAVDVRDAGDVDGDGFGDFIIGAFLADPNGGESGESYLIFGSDFSDAVTHLGSGSQDGMVGSGGADVMVAGRGNDVVAGNGGADVILAGQGNDEIEIADNTFKRIDGGSGSDSLILIGGGIDLDLTAIADSRLTNIETIDISDGANAITLNLREVLNISSTSNTLTVISDINGSIDIGSGWTQGSTQTIDGNEHTTYTQGNATLILVLKPDNIDPVLTVDALVTSDRSPELTGTVVDLDPATTVQITVDGNTYSATNNGDGTWTLPAGTISPDLADGVYEVTATGTDSSGNVGVDLPLMELTIDNGDPVVTIDSLATNASSPELTGTVTDLDPGTTVNVSIDGKSYPATNNGDGTWTLAAGTISPGLTTGVYEVAVTAVDTTGHVGTDATTNEVTIDNTAPVVTINDPGTTDVTSPELTGTVDDLVTTTVINVAVNGTEYTATNNGDGTWTLAAGTIAALPEGTYSVDVQATDAAGNQGIIDTPVDLIIDTAPVVTVNFQRTSDQRPGLTGTISDIDAATAVITVTVDGNPYTATNNGNGTWTVADDVIAVLADGTYDVLVSADDGTNVGTDTTTNDLVIDTNTPVVTINPLSTQDTTPGLAGTITTQHVPVTVTVDGVDYQAVNNNNGTWALADNVIAALAEGVYDVSVSATNLAENPTTGTDNTTDELRIDQTAPSATVDTLSTSDRSPELTGTVSEPDTSVITVTLSDGGGSFVATNNGDGTWTVPNDDITPDLTPGTYTITVTVVDTAGNTSGPVDTVDALTILDAPFTITIDPLATQDTTPQLTGEILGDFAGVVVVVTVNGTPYNATNNNDGTWTLADDTIAPALADGVYDVSVSGTNDDPYTGNDETTDELTIDTTAPVVTVDSLTTGDSTPALSGSIDDATATVTVTVNGVQYNATNNGSTWTLADNTIAPALINGTYDVSVTATDAAGNAGSDATTDELLIVTPPVSTIDLEDLLASNGGDGTQGVVYQGTANNDMSGVSVSSAGDINGDGFDDLIIGANETDHVSNNDGTAYVIFGQASGFPAEFDLSSVNGTNGFRIDALVGGDDLGVSVDSAGDVNGDGLDDLIVGASKADPNGNRSGSAFIIYGSASPFAASFDLTTLDGTNGYRFNGETSDDRVGFSVSGAGDVNGDGLDDVIIGAYDADDGVTPTTGRAYLVFGSTAAMPAVMTGSTLNGTNGFNITGVATGASTGFSVSSAGDMNGDGLADVRISASNETVGANADAGRTYVVFGSSAAFPADFNLATINGTNGFAIEGDTASLNLGFSGADAGDFNGDGFDDLIVSTPAGGVAGSPGQSYVIFGQAAAFPAALSIASLDGTNGFELLGADAGDDAGFNVSGVGDVNGDGFDDILIGARSGDGGGSLSGEAFLLFGRSGVFAASIDLGTIAGNGGIQINGVSTNDRAGRYVAGAGDVNGDGFDDLLVAAREANNSAGETYLIFGGDFTNSVTDLGAATNDTLTGSAARDAIIAGNGDDTSVGNGGPDVLSSGQGDDTLAISDINFVRVTGGNGFDTLSVDGSGITLDLTAISDARINGIEQIDLRGSGANTLTLDLQEVLNISGTSNTLLVLSDADDTVNIGAGWTSAGTELIEGNTFDVYTQGNATLKIFTGGDTIDPVVTVNALSTDDATPELTGTVVDADPNTTIQVTVNGINYAATNNGDGTWTLADNTITPALADGTYDVTVTATDTAGNVGTDATTNELVIDAAIPGDLNSDGFVGIADLNLILANWNLNVPPGNALADPSGDGFVGIDDLNLVLANWNAGTPPAQQASASTPEPEPTANTAEQSAVTTQTQAQQVQVQQSQTQQTQSADPLAEKVSLLDEVASPATGSSAVPQAQPQSASAWSWMQDAQRTQRSAFMDADEDDADSVLDLAMPDPDTASISRL